MAIIALAGCNNGEKQNVEGNETEQVEAAAPDDEGWMKQTTLMSNKPMVVDFYATWCPPCKELVPVLDKIEQEFEGQVIFKRIDVDQEPELAQEFKVEAIPMLLFITPTGDYQSLVGYQDAPVIESKIAELLQHSNQ